MKLLRRLLASSAQIQAFADDAATESALREALEGSPAHIHRASYAHAVEHLARTPSAQLVLVDASAAGAPAPELARSLRAVCGFDTQIVVIGADDRAEYALALAREGLNDYLVKPLGVALVREACANALNPSMLLRPHAGAVTVLTGAPGAGTSTVTGAIAHAFDTEGRLATVVNFAPAPTPIAVRLGARVLTDALDESVRADAGAPAHPPPPEGMPCEGTTHMRYLGYRERSVPSPVDPARIAPALAALANHAHEVLVLTGPSHAVRAAACACADTIVVVHEPELRSLTAAMRLLARIRLRPSDTTRLVLVCSHARTRRPVLDTAQLRYATSGRDADVTLPFDPELLATHRPGKRWLAEIERLRKRIHHARIAADAHRARALEGFA